MKWYKHDPSAALAGMIGLTVEERGAYYTLMDLQYARAPHNDVTDKLVIKALAIRPQTWRRLKASLVAKGKVHEMNGTLTANRVETEVKLAVKRMFKAGFNGGVSRDLNDLRGTESTSTTILESSLGKGREVPSGQVVQVHVNYRDPGVEYRSPPRTKSDNPLQPLPDKPPPVLAAKPRSEE